LGRRFVTGDNQWDSHRRQEDNVRSELWDMLLRAPTYSRIQSGVYLRLTGYLCSVLPGSIA